MRIQLWGIIYVLSLILSIVFIDRLIILNLPFSMEYEEWPCYVWLAISFVILCLISWFVVRCLERKEEISKHPWNEKIMLMFTNTAKGNYLDIFVLFVFLAFAAWIPDTVFDYIKDGQSWIRPFLYVGGLVLFVWGKPGVASIDKTIASSERKLLLTGMSDVSNKYQMNIYPLIEPLKTYTNIETFVILLSDSIWRGCNDKIDLSKEQDETLSKALGNYKNEINCLNLQDSERLVKNSESTKKVKSALENLLLAYIKKIPAYENKTINLVFSEPVDYNDFDACNNECYQILKYVMGEKRFSKYYDHEVVVNTTPGTAIVTSAMTINAIKGNRAMIYTTQGSKPQVKAANPNATLIQFDGLLEDREIN